MSNRKNISPNKIFPVLFVFLLIVGWVIYSAGDDGESTIKDFDKKGVNPVESDYNEDHNNDYGYQHTDPLDELRQAPQKETYKEEVDEDKAPEIESEEKNLDQDEFERRVEDLIPELEFDPASIAPKIEPKIEYGDSDTDKGIPGIKMPEKPDPPEKPE